MVDVVISGASCRLPQADSVEEFEEKLYSGVDMVTEGNPFWNPETYGLPVRCGTLKTVEKFDAAFFGIPPKQAVVMDPQLRILLELSYEAIVDSGTNVSDIRGSNTGVFVGTFLNEAQELFTADPHQIAGYEVTGCLRTMLANRISYHFDIHGPSYAIDTACSSGMFALSEALRAIRDGRCDSAIVGASNLLLKPNISIQFMAMKMLSKDGKCKSFDASADGYVRSEGVVVYFLQKASSARRIYARLVHAVDNCDGYTEQGVTFPSGPQQRELMARACKQAAVDPNSLSYMEAHGTGTQAGDPQETAAIAEVYCRNREGRLLIGSVKSNIGHTEATSGLAGILKVLLAYKNKVIPGNIHLEKLNPDIPALHKGQLQVVTENTPWTCGLVGVNSFGFGGKNVHVILSPPPEKMSLKKEVAVLTVTSGRSKAGCQQLNEIVKDNAADTCLQSLITAGSQDSLTSHPFRGFTLLNHTSPIQESQKCPPDKPPLWYIFGGMGSQWAGMGRSMLTSCTHFRQSIQRLDQALQHLDFSVSKLLQQADEATLTSPKNSFVGITSVQIALVDTLKFYGLTPDGMIGHSVGELGCAYADSTLTAAQTIQAAYWRGRCIEEARLDTGAMAAIGLTWEETKTRSPPGVVAACHNGRDTVTISGPEGLVADFVEELKNQEVFARMVNTSGVAFHSYLLEPCGPALKEALEKIIPSPKTRSKKWISSSVPESSWSEESALYSSASYHVNNFLSPVLFSEAVAHVPPGSVILEVGPHGLFGSVLRRQRNDLQATLSLMKKQHEDNHLFFLTNLGRCYMNGIPIDKDKICPEEIEFPVSNINIASHVAWNHEQDWTIPKYSPNSIQDKAVEVSLDPKNPFHYIRDHVVDGRVLFPGAGYVYLAWVAFARVNSSNIEITPVSVKNLKIQRATVISRTDIINLHVDIHPGSGRFEITEEGTVVASGEINSFVEDKTSTPGWVRNTSSNDAATDCEVIMLDADDVYKEMRIKGYDYGPMFRTIQTLNHTASSGTILWDDNWVTFIDAFLQAMAFTHPDRSLRLPVEIARMDIRPDLHRKRLIDSPNGKVCQVHGDISTHTLTAGGVTMCGLEMPSFPRHLHQKPALHQVSFIPYDQTLLQTHQTLLPYYQHCCHLADRIITKTSPKINGMSNGVLEDETKEEFSDKINLNRLNTFGGLLDMFLQQNDILETEQIVDICNKDPLIVPYNKPDQIQNYLGIVADNSTALELDLLFVEPDIFQSTLSAKAALDFALTKSPLVQYRTVYCPIQHYISSNKSTMEFENLPKKGFNKFDVVVVSAVSLCSCKMNLENAVDRILSVVKDRGFVILLEPTGHINLTKVLYRLCGVSMEDTMKIVPNNRRTMEEIFQKANCELISVADAGPLATQALFRKTLNIPKDYSVITVTGDRFDWVDELKTKLKQSEEQNSTVWLVALQGPHSGLVGCVNCLKLEPNGHQIRCLVNCSSSDLPTDILPGGPAFQELLHKDLVMNIYKDGQLGSFRHQHLSNEQPTVKSTRAALHSAIRGDIKSLHWACLPPSGTDVSQEVVVYYSALNFRDLMLASGRISPDSVSGGKSSHVTELLGLEFSGRNELQQPVMGVTGGGAMCTHYQADQDYLWQVPPSWVLEDAATIPMAYCTAYYTLVVRANIRSNESVLIHSAASSLGLAAIRVAQSLGCQLYVTVGTEQKAAFITSRHGIHRDHIFFSRNTDFTEQIEKATGGKGVDVILNTLTGEKLMSSVSLLADGGRFMELGKFDLQQNTQLGMRIFLKNATFHGIVVEHILRSGSKQWPEVWGLVNEGIRNGVVKPLPAIVYDMTQHEAAFRRMAEGTHIGKILLQMHKDESTTSQLPLMEQSRVTPLSLRVTRTTQFQPDKVMIITGGLGGLGLEMGLWMTERGVKHLILTSRSGVRSGYQKLMINRMQDHGCTVMVAKYNVADLSQTKELFSAAGKMGPVAGIFHLAAKVDDGHVSNQTSGRFAGVAEPKVSGVLHLDRVSRTLTPGSLQYFVVFSSLASGIGNAGQSNYGYANSFMERVMEKRRQDNLPGLAIQWGFMGDVGIVQDQLQGNDMYMSGLIPQRVSSFLHTLDIFLQCDVTVVSSQVSADRSQDQSEGRNSVETLQEQIVSATLEVLGISSPDEVNPESSLSDLGLDSLMTTEIRQVLGRHFSIQLTAAEVQTLTVNKLSQLAVRSVR